MHGKLESDNFFLRNLNPDNDDLTKYISWMTNTEQNKFIQGVRKNFSVEELKLYITEKNNSSDAILFGIFDKVGSNHIGNIKLEPIVEKNSAWVGILIGQPEYRGRGVGVEVITSLMRFCAEFLYLNHIYLGVDKNNIPALNLYKKLGFVEILNNTAESNALQMKYFLV
jgi:RimJ/RimL family protein N-acetyltransferase